MAFKTVQNYNEEKFGNFFLLRNDGDFADVIFLYEKPEDVLVADVHYLKAGDESGYAHCCGKGCPACARGIRTQTKLFIPVYNIAEDKIQFFDRSMRFEPQLQQDVFSRFPNPSEFVFRITRHGQAGSVDTTYEITSIAKNTVKSYAQILVDNNASMPDCYSMVCKDLTPSQMQQMLQIGDNPTSGSVNNDYQGYQAVPRNSSSSPAPSMPEVPTVGTPTYSVPPESDDLIGGEDSGEDDELETPNF